MNPEELRPVNNGEGLDQTSLEIEIQVSDGWSKKPNGGDAGLFHNP